MFFPVLQLFRHTFTYWSLLFLSSKKDRSGSYGTERSKMLKKTSKKKWNCTWISVVKPNWEHAGRVPLDVNVKACAKVKSNMRFFRWSASNFLLTYDSVTILIVVSKVFPRMFRRVLLELAGYEYWHFISC